MRVSKAIIALAIILAVSVGGWFLFASGDANQAGPKGGGRPPQPVYVAAAHEEIFGDRLEAIGTLSANESITVTAKAQGIVRALNFTDGQFVERGADIVLVDPGEQNAKLSAELANLEEQRKALNRTAGLARSNNTSQARLDEQTSAVKRAEANVAGARARVSDYRITAPFSGILGTRKVSPGALVSPGAEITTLDDISVVKLDFSIPENFLAALKPGLDIEAHSSAYPSEVFKGQVVTVDSRVDPVTRSVSIRAVLPNDRQLLRPGMLMVVELIKDRRKSLMIPEQALLPEGSHQFVYVVGADNTTATKTPIVIGRRRPGFVEVMDGLKVGDRIITEGNTDLRPGTKIEVLTPKVSDTPAQTAFGAEQKAE
jgi:membrane fusion protein (multidrug efflux system)